jgi:hypothetical protein
MRAHSKSARGFVHRIRETEQRDDLLVRHRHR